VEASVDGVLGGYGSVNARDVADSNAFILEMFNECPPGAADLVALGERHTLGQQNFVLRHGSTSALVRVIFFTVCASPMGMHQLGVFSGITLFLKLVVVYVQTVVLVLAE
jgi:hypothetical protein